MRSDLKQHRIILNKHLAEFNFSARQINEEKEKLKQSQAELYYIQKAQEIILEVAQSVQQEAHKKISAIVSKCLEMVFDNPYEFEIVFNRKRGKTVADIFLTRNGRRLDPRRSTGGGVVDIATFALRLSCLSLRLPKGRAFVALDEPFKHVSPDLRPKIAAMLEMLSEELGFQFLISTHMKALKLGKVYELD